MLPRTVFARSFTILVASGILIQGAMMAWIVASAPRPHDSPLFRVNIERYLKYLADDLAGEPTEAHARKLLEGTGFEVRATGPAHWETAEVFPSPDDKSHRGLASPTSGEPRWFRLYRGRPFFSIRSVSSAGPMTFDFLGPSGPPIDEPLTRLSFGIAILLTVFTVASFAMHRILHPITLLSAAFEEVKRGKLNVAVSATAQDELGRLSRAFNEMAASIEFLVKDKERLFTELSHEFRAPIARASAANALVEDSELRDSIQKDLSELDSLIHALLTAARLEANPESSTLQTVELGSLLEEVVELFPQATSRIELCPPATNLSCHADHRSLRTLFRNLVENALKYSAPDQKIQISLGSDDRNVWVKVQDHGIGISASELSSIFLPFFRSSQPGTTKQSGFGLGLALCLRVARAHRGELQVQSSEGKGTTVTALFPLS